jgi:hypothetical protein
MGWESAQRSEAATVVSELAAARAGAHALPALRDSLRVRRVRLAALDSALIGGATPSAAAANLASALEEMAADADVKVSAMQLHADSIAPGGRGGSESGLLLQVGVRMTATADVYGLLALLRAIEGGESLLAVRELAVSQPEPAAPRSKPESLRLDVMVVGIARISAPEAR